MKKITLLLFTVLAVCWYSNAQFSFPAAGPISVTSGGTLETIDINNAANAAGVPAGQYITFTVTVDWSAVSGDPWSNEARLVVQTNGTPSGFLAPNSGGASSGASTTLTFSGTLPGGNYDPSVDAAFLLSFNQTFGGSTANWSNIVVTLGPPNNDCINAEPVSCGMQYIGNTTLATNSGGNAGRDVYYSLAGTSFLGDVTLSLCGSSYDTFLYVFDACNGTLITSNDDFCGLQSEVTFTSDGTTTYIIRVDGFNAAAFGSYTLDVDCVPLLCPEPTNIAVSNVTGTSAIVTWDAGGAETDWEIAVQTAGTGEPVGAGTPVSTTTYTDNTLNVSTDYEVYVRANCGGTDGDSFWAGPVNFTTTNCENGTPTVIFTEEFDNTSAGWTGTVNGGSGTWIFGEVGQTPSTGTGPSGAESGSDYMFYEASFSGNIGSSATASTVSPAINLTALNAAEMSFYLHAFGAAMGTLNVGVSNSATGPFTTLFTQTGQLQTSVAAPWVLVDINLDAYAGQTIYIEFENIGAGGAANTFTGDMSIDLLTVEGCIAPTPVTYTYTNGWDGNGDPDGVSTINDDILVVSGEAVFASNTKSKSITVNPAGALSINASVTLESVDGINLESTSIEYSSIISNGTINGPVIYERYVNAVGTGTSGGNDLIGMPLLSAGQGFDDFLAIEDLSNVANSSKIATNGSVFAFGPYDNSGNGQYVNYAVSATDLLVPGKGYRAATAGETLTFAGDVETGSVQITITRPINGSQWNLVGNPYPSYMDPLAFLADNAAALDPNAVAIYGYHAGTDSGSGTYQNFTIVNNNSRNTTLITPGQGFLLATFTTPGTSETITFNPAIRTVLGSDDFILGRNANDNLNLKLKLSNGTNNFITDFYFNDNSSLGLDPGYDAVLFGNTVPSFAIYSHLVQDNEGRNMAIQSLGSTDLSDVNVPLGIKVSQGQQVTIGIETSNLPDNVLVYLEDNLTNTFTLLNTGDYTFTASTNINGTGRFFLRYNEDTLSTAEQSLSALQIFTTKAPSALVINGQLSGKTTLALYDIQGRLVLETTLNESETSQRIEVSHLNSGVYVANISSNTQQKTQKVIIR